MIQSKKFKLATFICVLSILFMLFSRLNQVKANNYLEPSLKDNRYHETNITEHEEIDLGSLASEEVPLDKDILEEQILIDNKTSEFHTTTVASETSVKSNVSEVASTPNAEIVHKEEIKDDNDINFNNVLVLVNKIMSLQSSYKPKNLIIPNVRFSFKGPNEKQKLLPVAAKALEELFSAADKEGMILYAVSGYRSYSTQQVVYNGHVKRIGQIEADKISAKPGHSEHQTGLAMDISCKSIAFDLDESFGNTAEGKWVADNAHKFGFIIRYQLGKEHLTGYKYEPWHLRYVGSEVATEIYENDLILEEYLLSIN